MEELKIKLAVLEARQDLTDKIHNERLTRLEQDSKEFRELVKTQNEQILTKLESLEKHRTATDSQKQSIWKTITVIGAFVLGTTTIGKLLFDIFKH